MACLQSPSEKHHPLPKADGRPTLQVIECHLMYIKVTECHLTNRRLKVMTRRLSL